MASLYTKVSISALLLCAVGASHTLAKLTPPPLPSISNINVDRKVSLDRVHQGSVSIKSTENGGYPSLELNGYTLFIDGTLYSNSWRGATIAGKGSITSNNNTIGIVLGKNSEHTLELESTIRDNGHKVGLKISSEGKRKGMGIAGNEPNTFTGDVELSNVSLSLRKRDGVVSIKGNVFVNKNATLGFDTSHQLAHSSVVTLNEGKLRFGYWGGDVTQSFKRLTVDNYGILSFGHENSETTIKKLYLDDLLIRSNGELKVEGWAENRDFILVRKTSENVEDALKKIKFEGYDPSRIHLEDYNNEYWMINGAPEPAAYGAALMLGVLGLVAYRQRCSRPVA